MKVLTLITKRSVREVAKEKKFLKFFSTQDFSAGAMIEIIDGNKKSPAIILKSEPAANLKEEIRSGEITLKKLKFSKTGANAEGKVFDNFQISEIKNFLKNPNEAKSHDNKNISSFFPRIYKTPGVTQKASHNHLASQGSTEKRRTGEALGISEILEKNLESILNKDKTYNNPMQERIDTIRKYFYENARYGYGSFSYYIGMFKQIPEREVDQIFAEVKHLKKSTFDKKKLF